MAPVRLRRPGWLAAATIVAAALAPAGTASLAHGAPAPLAPHVPGRVLLGFRPGVSPAQAAAAVAAVGAADTKVIGDGTHVLALRGRSIEATITALLHNPAVRYAEPDGLVSLASVPCSSAEGGTCPNDPDFPEQWALQNTGQSVNGTIGTAGDDIDVTRAWSTTTGSASVVIGLIDDGYSYTQADLAPNAWSNPGGVNGCAAGTHGYDAATGACNPGTGSGHGSIMAAIMGAAGDNGQGTAGVNWTTAIMGLSFDTTDSNSVVISAIQWAVAAKQAGVNVRVLNMSFVQNPYSQALADEIATAGSNGMLVVAGAGNGGGTADQATGQNNDGMPQYPCNYGEANEICVAAVDQNFNLWSVSDYGVNSVDLAAPGVNICGVNSTCSSSGTSDATAIVTGAAALLAAANPSWSVSALRAAIVDNVRPVPSLSGLVRTGGVLDVECAMTNCRNTPPPGNTSPPSSTTATAPPPSGGGSSGGSTPAGTGPGTSSSSPPATSAQGGATTTTPPAKPLTRLAGADRIATAIAVSEATFPGAGSAGVVVLARADDFADALAGTPLAVTGHAPLLLNPPGSGLDPRVAGEITRVLPQGGTVYVLGGDAALSSTVDAQLSEMGEHPVRLAGPDRYQSALVIARQLGDPATVFEATGLDFPDALAAGAAAAHSHGAVLLTEGTTMPPPTASYLGAHPGATRYAVGGPAAQADPGAAPVAGADRFGTAVDVAGQFFGSPPVIGAASGLSFPDALAGGPEAAAAGGPLLLVPATGPLPSAVASYLSANAPTIGSGWLYGGTAAVGGDVAAEVQAAISG